MYNEKSPQNQRFKLRKFTQNRFVVINCHLINIEYFCKKFKFLEALFIF